MGKMSKGVRAFGVYFIVYACLMFLGRTTSIIFHLIESITLSAKPSTRGMYCYGLSDVVKYSSFDAIVDFIGLGLAVLVLFAALRVFKLSKLALMSIKIVCLTGVGYNVTAIIKDLLKIVYYPEEVRWMGYMIAGGMATCFLSIGFWCFVFYFFNRKNIKEQFTS